MSTRSKLTKVISIATGGGGGVSEGIAFTMDPQAGLSGVKLYGGTGAPVNVWVYTVSGGTGGEANRVVELTPTGTDIDEVFTMIDCENEEATPQGRLYIVIDNTGDTGTWNCQLRYQQET